MLRYAGMFVGADAGPRATRKFHESKIFRDCNKKILIETINFSHSPKGVRQFEEHVLKAQSQLERLVTLIDKQQLLKTYWGEHEEADIWGWKDPRNSATAIVWREIFPGMRVLVIKRAWSRQMRQQIGGSESGDWFRQSSSRKLREMYWHPPGIDGLDSYVVNFDRLLIEASELESLLQWIGLSIDPIREFDLFLDRVRVDT